MQLPKPPKFTLAVIGPGIVLIAMGLGSGEFILWPYLVAQYGFGVLWGAVVGITLQLILSNEAGRYTLATGGSTYIAFQQLWRWAPLWFIVSTFLSFAWPGIIGSGGKILGDLIGVQNHKWLTIAMLIFIGVVLTFGGKVYNSLERFQKIVILISIPVILLLAIPLINPDALVQVAAGLGGIGEGYLFLPSGISLLGFLGAVAYAGAGGNLILAHTFYIQDEGMGMASHLDTQVEAGSKSKNIPHGSFFQRTPQQIQYFKGWLAITFKEQFFSFWFIGLLSIIVLAFISYNLVYPYNGVEGLEFLNLQAEGLSLRFGNWAGLFFLVSGVVFLFTTQLGIFETTSRLMTENIQLMSHRVKNRVRRSRLFFAFLWAQVIAASVISLFGLEQPIQILLVGTFFSALSMFGLSILTLMLNRSHIIPDELKASSWRKAFMLISIFFYGIFVVLTVLDIL